MAKQETKYLTHEGALLVAENFRWFAGFKFRCKQLSANRYKVTAPRWCWSFIVLLPQDYA